jgi:SfnB family sulfur acquisition oxidoreductase
MTSQDQLYQAAVLTGDTEVLLVAQDLADKIRAGAADRDRYRTYPTEELEVIARSGFLGAPVPPEFGGPGASRSTVLEAFRVLGQADPSIAQILLIHFNILESHRLGARDKVTELLFSKALKGERISNAVAERGTKKATDRRTRLAKLPGGDHLLSGRNFYSTGAAGSSLLMVHALTPEDALAMAFVDSDADGVQVLDDWTGFGQRSSGSGSVVFEDVRVPNERVVIPSRSGPSLSSASSQALHAAIDTGIARAALVDGLAFIRERARPFSDSGLERASDEPHVLLRVGWLNTRLSALEALLRSVGSDIDAAECVEVLTPELSTQISMVVAGVKALSAEVSLDICTEMLELCGTSATDEEDGLDRHWRNARTHTLHDPARWKYHHIGNFVLNGTPPPRSHLI